MVARSGHETQETNLETTSRYEKRQAGFHALFAAHAHVLGKPTAVITVKETSK